MKSRILLFTLLISNFFLSAQPNWSEDIAEIIYSNCTSCHNPKGIGPFSLMDYDDVVGNAYYVRGSVTSKSMPPWIADNHYQSYSSTRVLTTNEIEKITQWIDAGSPKGDLSLAPPKPIYDKIGFIQKKPDLSVQITTYTSKATASGDDYVCFTIPSGLTKDRKIKAVEVIPGNLQIVHHALIFIDDQHETQTDTIGGDCASPSSGTLVTAYVPGSTPVIFPSTENFKSGMSMTAGSDVIVAMHFPEGSYGEVDSTKVNFYFYEEGVEVREIIAADLLQNWDFYLPPNKETNVFARYPSVNSGIPIDATLLSVFPHMHLLGKSIKSYALSPNKDTIPFVNIPKWNFEWQDFYFFKHMLKVPKGSIIYGKGVFDNTTTNPYNPNNPPISVYPGLNTTDEMLLFYFHYMQYEEGDELVNVDSLTQQFLPTYNPSEEVSPISVSPNPITDKTTISYTLKKDAFVSIYIYDVNGKLVKKVIRANQKIGNQAIDWNCQDVPPGVYFYSILINGKNYSGRILKM